MFNPFVPLANNPTSNTTLYGWIQSYAYINSVPVINANGTECPPQYRYNAGNLYTASYDVQIANMDPGSSLSYANYYYVDSQKPVTAQLLTYNQNSGKITQE